MRATRGLFFWLGALLAAQAGEIAQSDAWDEVQPPRTEEAVVSEKKRKEESFVAAYKETGDVQEAARRVGISKTTAYEIKKRRGL